MVKSWSNSVKSSWINHHYSYLKMHSTDLSCKIGISRILFPTLSNFYYTQSYWWSLYICCIYVLIYVFWNLKKMVKKGPSMINSVTFVKFWHSSKSVGRDNFVVVNFFLLQYLSTFVLLKKKRFDSPDGVKKAHLFWDKKSTQNQPNLAVT